MPCCMLPPHVRSDGTKLTMEEAPVSRLFTSHGQFSILLRVLWEKASWQVIVRCVALQELGSACQCCVTTMGCTGLVMHDIPNDAKINGPVGVRGRYVLGTAGVWLLLTLFLVLQCFLGFSSSFHLDESESGSFCTGTFCQGMLQSLCYLLSHQLFTLIMQKACESAWSDSHWIGHHPPWYGYTVPRVL